MVLFLCAGILAMIIVRTLNRDIARYNRIDDEVGTDEVGIVIQSSLVITQWSGSTLSVPTPAIRELLNNGDCRPLHQAKVKERCRSHWYAAGSLFIIMRFIELIKESACIIFKCHTLLNVELNKTHAVME